ncbi:GAF domain-containing protein [Nocardia brasiliensis]|uniref:GAF domain-containing protein n=1 Tax=Nocardia brasiliensis TaxID=37326 RepID=UPI002454FD8C|nr:GAF domain-containing protein [Nocardia brasiliensis]
MGTEWLLIECIRETPTVMAVGRKPLPLKDIDAVLRGPRRSAARRAVAQVRETGERFEERSETKGEHIVAEPIKNVLGMVHGVRLWVGDLAEEIPVPSRSGAWDWDEEKITTLATEEMHDIYAVPRAQRLPEVARISGLRHVTTADDKSAALAASLSAELLTDMSKTIQTTWQIKRDDNVLRDINFVARGAYVDGTPFLHGITHDITPGGVDDNAVVPPLTYAEALIEGELRGNEEWPILVDLRSLTGFEWLREPMPEVAWERTGISSRNPALHPDDIPAARDIARRCRRDGHSGGTVRVRKIDGSWMTVDLTAKLVLLTRESETSAALVKLRRPPAV